MTLCAVCPKEWVTVSNGIDVRYESYEKGKRVIEKFDCKWFMAFYENEDDVVMHEFEQTPKISTYLYAICSGPYVKFEDFDPFCVP
jgi:aminopeptidase N